MLRFYSLLTPKKRICQWILNTIKDGSWKKGYDLHIDEIDKAHIKKTKKWIASSINYFLLARRFLIMNKLPFSVELYIELESKQESKDYLIKNINELHKDLTDTPPSLYLWSNEVPLDSPSPLIPKQLLPNFLNLPKDIKATYGQFYDTNFEEIRRFVQLQ